MRFRRESVAPNTGYSNQSDQKTEIKCQSLLPLLLITHLTLTLITTHSYQHKLPSNHGQSKKLNKNIISYLLSSSRRTSLPTVSSSLITPSPGHYHVRDDLLHPSTSTHNSVFTSKSHRALLPHPNKVTTEMFVVYMYIHLNMYMVHACTCMRICWR